MVTEDKDLKEIEHTSRLKLQNIIIGRDKEIEAIKMQLDTVLEGHSALTVIAGDTGIGKTALIRTSLADLSNLNGFWVYAKFEQYKEKEPYIAIIQIIERITNYILTLPEEKLGRIKKELKKELGKDGALISDIVPQAERVIGKQSKIKVNDYQKLNIRLAKTFQTLLSIGTKELYPLIITVDDIQWADTPSMDIIKAIIENLKEVNLYIILVYRNNLEEYRTRMKLTLDELAGNEHLLEINLDSLTLKDVKAMLLHVFGENIENVNLLARLIHGATLGNPLLIKQMINLLLDNEEIRFNSKKGTWRLETENIRAYNLPGNIEDIIKQKKDGLNPVTKEFIEILACVGSRFNREFLEIATKYDSGFIEEELKALCNAGLIVEIGESSEEGWIKEYEFSHDRIYQNVYEPIDPERKEQIHFDLAIKLLNHPDKIYVEENILSITAHLLNCKRVIKREGAGSRLIIDLYVAGLKAKQSAAIEHALKLFSFCEELLGNSCWQQNYAGTLKIKLELAQCEYICGRYEASKTHFKEMLAHATSSDDLAEIKKQYMILNSYTGDHAEVIDLGLQALKHLGFNLRIQRLQVQIAKEILYGKVLFRNSRLESIKNAPIVIDKRVTNALEILTIIAPSANLTNEDLFALIVLKIGNLSAKHGNSIYSPLGYAAYSLVLGSVLGDFKKAKRIEEISLTLTEIIDDDALKCTAYFVIGTFIDHWTSPARQSLDYLQKGFDFGIRSGEFFYGGFTITSMIEMKYSMGEPLEKLEKFLELHRKHGKKMNHDVLLRLIKIFTDHIRLLTVPDSSPEDRMIDDEEISKLDTIEVMTYYLLKLQRLYFAGKVEEAYCLSQKTIRQFDYYYLQVDFVFYFLLLSLEKRKHQKGHPDRRHKKTFKKYRKKLQKWAELNPENHNGKYLLIEALDSSVNNHQQNASKLYDAAIEHAKENHNLLLEALGNYLAADYYSANKKIAGVYARDACRLFNEWGSEKTANRIRMLFEIYDDFAVSETAAAGNVDEIADNTGPERGTSFEQRLQDCQKELEEMELEAAYQYFLNTVCIETGSDCGAILPEEEDQVKLKYMWQDGKEGFRYPAGIDLEQIEHLPKKVLRYASRTYEEVIIETKPAEGIFAGDDCIRAREGISIICLPLKYKDIFAGLIYLESKINHWFDYETVGYIKRLSFYLVARQVLEREPEKSGKVFTNDTVNEQLTDREAEVLYYMAEAMSNKKIGEKLHISSSTVKTHTKSIYGKLEVSSRVQAVIKAKALKLV